MRTFVKDEIVLAKILVPHDATKTYHEWISLDNRVKLDRIGRNSPKMIYKNATQWVCNNPDCLGKAVVSDAAALLCLKEAEDGY